MIRDILLPEMGLELSFEKVNMKTHFIWWRDKVIINYIIPERATSNVSTYLGFYNHSFHMQPVAPSVSNDNITFG
jgi:hypothetical protein